MTAPIEDLRQIFWTQPELARMTMTRRELRAALLKHEGWISACGQMWDIVSKHIGAGVYEVSLKPRNP